MNRDTNIDLSQVKLGDIIWVFLESANMMLPLKVTQIYPEGWRGVEVLEWGMA